MMACEQRVKDGFCPHEARYIWITIAAEKIRVCEAHADAARNVYAALGFPATLIELPR